MKFVKIQITKNTCEYIAYNDSNPESFNALTVSISTTGSHEIRNSIHYGNDADEEQSSELEFIGAFRAAESRFKNLLPPVKMCVITESSFQHSIESIYGHNSF